MAKQRTRTPKKSLGGYLLTRLSDNQAEIAAKIGKSKPAVSQFIAGTSPVSAETRQKIEATYPTVPAKAWEEPWPDPPASRPRKASKPKTLDELHGDLVRSLEADLDALNADIKLDTAKRADARGKILKTLNETRKLTGDNAMDMAKILALPEWRRIQERLVQAVTPFGSEALAAVAEALRELEAL